MSDGTLDLLAAALRRVAPEVDLEVVDHGADLLDELDLDSMDFLTLVEELHQRAGVEIPEEDYAHLDSVNGIVEYLRNHST